MERPGAGSLLALHVLPKLGKVPVADVDQTDIRDTLAPIWHTKADTATKAVNRLGIRLTHAAALGLDVDLQATKKAKALLGRQRHKVQNVPAVPRPEVPAVDGSLSDGFIPHLALRILILTGVRFGQNRPSQAPGPGWLSVPQRQEGRNLGHDHGTTHGADQGGSLPERLPFQPAQLAGRGHRRAPRGGRKLPGPGRGRHGRAGLSPDELP